MFFLPQRTFHLKFPQISRITLEKVKQFIQKGLDVFINVGNFKFQKNTTFHREIREISKKVSNFDPSMSKTNPVTPINI